MPKDRSFAQRIHQSNIDRQRNQEYFLSRPAVSAPEPQEPKVGLWGRTVAFLDKHRLALAIVDCALAVLIACEIFGVFK